MLIMYQTPPNPLLTELFAIWIFVIIPCKKAYQIKTEVLLK